jgi:hypothetical protein
LTIDRASIMKGSVSDGAIAQRLDELEKRFVLIEKERDEYRRLYLDVKAWMVLRARACRVCRNL